MLAMAELSYSSCKCFYRDYKKWKRDKKGTMNRSRTSPNSSDTYPSSSGRECNLKSITSASSEKEVIEIESESEWETSEYLAFWKDELLVLLQSTPSGLMKKGKEKKYTCSSNTESKQINYHLHIE
jgi:hypothetical protein